MKNPMSIILPALAVLFAAECGAQPAADPTRMSSSMGEVIKAQLAEFRALEIKGLVSATGTGGVAVVHARGDDTFRVARRGSTLPLSAAGVPFPVRVKDVTDNGVEVAAETLDARWTIPVAFAKDGSGAGAPTGTLAYVEFEELTLKTALRLLADQSGRNFVWTERSANVPVSLFLRGVTVEKAVDELCKSHRLWYRLDGESGITRIVTMEEFKESLTGYQQEEMIETFTLLYPNVTEVASIIQGIYADRVRLTLGDQDILDDELSDLGRRFEKFQAISDTGGSSDLMGNFSSINSARNSIGYGRRGGGVYSSRGGMWFNTGVSRQAAEERRAEERIERFGAEDAVRVSSAIDGGASNSTVAAALVENRYQPPSVYVTVARRSNMLVVRTGDPRIMDEIRKLVRKVDVPTPMVYLEVEIMRLTLDDGVNSVFDWDLKDVTWNNGKIGAELDGTTAFSPDAPGRITFNIVSKHVESHIKLQRERGKLKSIATPSLLTAHSEVSQFFMGEEIPIVKNITASIVAGDVNSKSIIVPQTEMEWRKIGTRLLITPNINADRTVTLRLMQETSARKENGGTIIASVVDQATQTAAIQEFKVDTVEAKSIAGTFVAQDEMAVVAGGMIEETFSDAVNGVPLLMDVPWLGWFFRSTEKVRTRSELVIYMKPHVISTPGDIRRVTQGVTADKVRNPNADRLRSAENLEQERKDREEARSEQKNATVLPDVDTFHIK
ncbi:MAG: hypothetical protein J6T01_00125 [Kiritimatiellae bacterium]|nr:hypothetical protein [Kiritimatiellia bacterium]